MGIQLPGLQNLPDHDQRLAQARKRAEGELGDGSWADVIVAAYCNPDGDAKSFEMDKD